MPARQDFWNSQWIHRQCHGGDLRRRRSGRGARPLSTRDPLHLVFKANREVFPQGFRAPVTYTLVLRVVRRYARRFAVKVEQISIQGNHLHLLVRTGRRSQYQYFFRVVAGQIAQRVTGTFKRSFVGKVKFWRHRPFTRIVTGWRACQRVRNYIQLNEKEARGEIPYSKLRWKGLTPEQIAILWT